MEKGKYGRIRKSRDFYFFLFEDSEATNLAVAKRFTGGGNWINFSLKDFLWFFRISALGFTFWTLEKLVWAVCFRNYSQLVAAGRYWLAARSAACNLPQWNTSDGSFQKLASVWYSRTINTSTLWKLHVWLQGFSLEGYQQPTEFDNYITWNLDDSFTYLF